MLKIDTENEQIRLTRSELTILYEVMKGFNNRHIAKNLNISMHTVKFHLQNLMSKTYTHTRTELCTKILFSLLGKPLSPELLFENLA